MRQATLSEPIAVLVQESLAALNIRTTIDKIPGSNWRGEMMKKTMPFMINFFSGWLDYPEYFFFFTYHGQNAVFNTMSYKNPALDQVIGQGPFTRCQGGSNGLRRNDQANDHAGIRRGARIPLFQPYLTVASQKSIGGYVYSFSPPARLPLANKIGLTEATNRRDFGFEIGTSPGHPKVVDAIPIYILHDWIG